jgi:hypothetical protein
MVPQRIRRFFKRTRRRVICLANPAMREHELRNFSGHDSLVFATTTRMTDGLD